MEKLKEILSRILQIDTLEITDQTSPYNVETWDSFNGLMLVSELEKGFDIKFSMEEVIAVTCVGDIKKALMSHGVEL